MLLFNFNSISLELQFNKLQQKVEHLCSVMGIGRVG